MFTAFQFIGICRCYGRYIFRFPGGGAEPAKWHRGCGREWARTSIEHLSYIYLTMATKNRERDDDHNDDDEITTMVIKGGWRRE